MVDTPHVVRDHAVQLVLGQIQEVVVQGVAGGFPGAVLDVVGLVQHHNLARQVDLQLVERGRAEVKDPQLLKLNTKQTTALGNAH